MNSSNFYLNDIEEKKIILESYFGNRGYIVLHTNGMCGEIFIFDQAQTTYPGYSCVKIPKPIKDVTNEEIAKRFLRELKLQLSFYHNNFVHWAFDFDIIMDVPIASFRYWGNDLAKVIEENTASQITKLSLILYTCLGLRHCYKKGLRAHQDLKPANIFIRDIKKDFFGLPNLDVFNFAIIADFGLANAFEESNFFEGSRPYMAPEQWKKENLSEATDIFALGVILHELMTDGFHPVGIKLSDFWPEPKNGNTKKWTKSDEWEKWIREGCNLKYSHNGVNKEIIDFIIKMLSISSIDRPSLNEVINFIFEQIKKENLDSYLQIDSLISQFEGGSTDIRLDQDWPYLNSKWNILQEHFNK